LFAVQPEINPVVKVNQISATVRYEELSTPFWSFSNTEMAENVVQQVVRIHLTKDYLQLPQRLTQFQRNQFVSSSIYGRLQGL
jgi:hypothetical protein